MDQSFRQPHAKAARYAHLGFQLFTLGAGKRGAHYWWKRTGSALDVVREKDGKEKHQDVGEGHPKLCDVADERANAQWARAMVVDDLASWR